MLNFSLKSIKYRLRVPLIRLLLASFSKLPLRANHWLGSLLGRALNHFDSDLIRIADTNLRLCFPEISSFEHQQIRRASFIEMGKTMAEIAILWRHEPARVASLVTHVDGFELIEQALAKGRGLILLSPHLGCWEIVSIYVSQRYPMTNMFRPLKIGELTEEARQGRSNSGAELVPTDMTGVKKLLAALKRGEIVGILPDQEPGQGGGSFAPFFGVQTNTMTLCSRLAHKTQAEVLSCFAERLPQGQGYRLKIFPMPDAIRSANELESLTTVNAAIEKLIRLCPQQYQWSYKRFRVRPDGEPPIY